MLARALPLLFASLLLSACPAPKASAPAPPTSAAPEVPVAAAPAGRLPDAIAPKAYRLSLDIEPGRAKVRGVVEIDLTISEAVSSVWLHGVELTIERATLHHAGQALALSALPAPPERGLLGFAIGRTLMPGEATLHIEFVTSLRQSDGIFHQRYQGRWYAYTDFEPIDARRAFPCFDDPRWKTPWTVSLEVPAALRAFSNTPIARTRAQKGDRKRVEFMTTPPLPSYLVAFAVGPFEIVDHNQVPARAQDLPTPIRIITFPGHQDRATRALVAARALLPLAARWTDMAVPFRKLDFIAVPRFDGAMENPGLVTVSNRILHIDSIAPAPSEERLMTLVVAHEIAHLWFGDLVTMQWWDDLWLNEGFATYLADELIESWKPAWRWHLERQARRSRAYDADARADARAVRQAVTTDQEIRESFDVITYIKGGAILEMLEHWLGHESFQAGVRSYLRAHAGKSATTNDLVRALEAATEGPVRALVESYVDQTGAPLFDEPLRCTSPAEHAVVEHRIAASLVGEKKSAQHRQWLVPTCAELGYRLAPYWQPSSERQVIQSIQWAQASMRSADRARNARGRKMLAAMARSAQHGAAAEALVAALVELENLLPQTPDLEPELRATLKALSWNRRSAERTDDRDARPQLLELAARHMPVPTSVRARADQWLAKRSGLAPELVTATLVAVAVRGDSALHARMLAELQHENNPEHRGAIVEGLASFAAPALLKLSLARTVDRALPRVDAIKLLYRALKNPHTRRQSYRFIEAKIKLLEALYRTSPFMSRFACVASEITIAQSMIVSANLRAPRQQRLLGQLEGEFRTCKRLRDHYQSRATEAR